MVKRICALILGVLIFLLFGNASVSVEAQTPNCMEESRVCVDPIELTGCYSAVLYDNSNGLPTSEANAITHTTEGFVWIGSYSGLIRYDGNSFERMDSTNGIASVISLYVDSKERLWVGTNDNGIAVIETGEVKMLHKTDGLPASSVRSIVEDASGNIYASTTNGIAVIDQDFNVHTFDDSKISHEFIDELKIGYDDVIYGVTIDGNVFTIKDGKLSDYYTSKQLGIDGIISILPDENNPGYIYIGTERSKIYYGRLKSESYSFSEIKIEPLSNVKDMSQIDNELWICTDSGIGVIKDGKFHNINKLPMNNSIEQVMADYQGNLWFVSSRQGVMKIVKNQFSDLFEKFNISSNVVNSTCKIGDWLFIGEDSGLTVLDEVNSSIVNSIPIKKVISSTEIKENDLIKLLEGVRIRSIIKDSTGQIWISTWKKLGLLCYDNGILTVFNEADGLPSNRVRTVSERQDGSIMVACTGGIAIIRNGKVEKVYGQDIGIENPEVLTVTENENHDIVLGTDGGGIYVINDSKVTHIGVESGLISEVIMRVKRDNSRNIIWIVTSNSLAYMDETYHVTTINTFPYPNNFDIYQNSQDEMWILSSNGIYVTTVNELLTNDKISTVFYGKDNGLSCITTGNSYSSLSKNGDLYISGTTGVSKVNIEKPFEDVDEIKMAVPFVGVDDKYVYPNKDGAFVIPASTQKLTLYSYVYTYSLDNPQVTYYLDGFESGQNVVSRRDLVPIDYTNLKGGRYHFVMILKDAMGHGNHKMSILIEKEKAFYEKVWFYILIVILIIILIEELIRLKTRRKIKKYQKRDERNRAIIRGITRAFAKVIDMKDEYTNGHSFRVAEYTAMLAEELGYSEQDVEKFYDIALLHDVGKIGIPKKVLNKDGNLTEDEYEEIKTHTTLGYDILKEITIMPELADGARYHHERIDGKGYNGLVGDEIPKVVQIIAVADTFDAMYSDRPYRKRMNFDKVCSVILEGAGTQFAEDVVAAFFNLVYKGKFKAPDDFGGGTTEEVDNVGK